MKKKRIFTLKNDQDETQKTNCIRNCLIHSVSPVNVLLQQKYTHTHTHNIRWVNL